jgi:hypothetical protein
MSKKKSKRRLVEEMFEGHSRFVKLSWSGYGSKVFGGLPILLDRSSEKRHWELEDSLVM